MNKSSIHGLCKRFGLSPNKKLGQNFLISNNITEKIIKAIDIMSG